jgi:hypothetical protein
VLYNQKQEPKIDRVSPNRRERTERELERMHKELIRLSLRTSATEAAMEADHD